MGESSTGDIALPIEVFQTQTRRAGGAYWAVWDAEQAMYIRNKLRLLGDLGGTLPKHIAQNQYLSVPLLLSREETTVGVQRGLFRVVSDDGADYAPPADAARRFWARRAREAARQAADAARERDQQRARRVGAKRARERAEDERAAEEEDGGAVRKAARRMWQWVRRGAGRWLRGGAAEGEGEGDALAEEEQQAAAAAERADGQPQLAGARAHTLVETSAAARAEEGARRAARRVAGGGGGGGGGGGAAARRVQVVQALQARGYGVSCGAKFGADLLAYAASPALVHAALAVVVLRAGEALPARRLVAVGRLGDATRKRALLAAPAPGRVAFVAVQWEETLP